MPLSGLTINFLVGALGAALGAALTLLVKKHLVRDKVRVEYRASTYSSFIDAVASLAHATTSPNAGNAEVVSAAAACAGIAIYGESTVVAKLADFLRNGAKVSCDPDGFTELVRAMRSDITGDTTVSKEDLKILLVGAPTPSQT